MEDRYKMLERIGEGGMGTVFKAYDTRLSRFVAAKRLLSHKDAEANIAQAEKIQKEARALAQMHHANIVSIFDVASDEEGIFIVMEMLEGEDLSDWIEQSPLDLQDFREMTEQLLEALIYAHGRNLLHRDIKPQNIRILRQASGRLQAKLVDLGLATISAEAKRQTRDQVGNVLGSVAYMAPEQIQNKPLDARADIYSLGCVLYQVLCGKQPFTGNNVQEIMSAHLEHRVKSVGEINTELPEEIPAWIMWVINQDREQRPASASEALDIFRATVCPLIAVRNATVGVAPIVASTRARTTVVPIQQHVQVEPPKATKAKGPDANKIAPMVFGSILGLLMIVGIMYAMKAPDKAKSSGADSASASAPPPSTEALAAQEAAKSKAAPPPEPAKSAAAEPAALLPARPDVGPYKSIPDAVATKKITRYKRPTIPFGNKIAYYFNASDYAQTYRAGDSKEVGASPGEPVFYWKNLSGLGVDFSMRGDPKKPEIAPTLRVVRIPPTNREFPVLSFEAGNLIAAHNAKGRDAPVPLGVPFSPGGRRAGISIFQLVRNRVPKGLTSRTLRINQATTNTNVVSIQAHEDGSFRATLGNKHLTVPAVAGDNTQFSLVGLVWNVADKKAFLLTRPANGKLIFGAPAPAVPEELDIADALQIGDTAAKIDQPGYKCNGEIADTLIYNQPFSEEECRAVEAWFSSIYFEPS